MERRKTQLEGAYRAGFEKDEAKWREELDKDAAKIKDGRTRLGMQARETWYHIDNVREYSSEYWLPVYEERKQDR